jgi:hypothetical protein
MTSDTENSTTLDGGFSESAKWPVTNREGKIVTFAMGDRATGPVVHLAAYPEGAPVYRSQAHSHRSDSFRMAVGPGAEQFKDGAKWLGHGDFLLMGANDRYVETMGADGVHMFLLTADRRGWPHGYQQNLENNELMAAWPAMAEKFFEKEELWPVYESDDQAIHGLRASFAPVPKERRVWGSFTNRDGWHVMSDGSEVAVMFLGDSDRGPAVILSHNRPNTVEIGHHRLAADTFRLVLDGSVQVGETRYGPGQFRQSSASQDRGPVVHGPDGSSQVLVLADRASALLTAEHEESTAASTQWPELKRELAALIST